MKKKEPFNLNYLGTEEESNQIRRESPEWNVEADLGPRVAQCGLLTWTLKSGLGMMGGPQKWGIPDKRNV